MHIKLMLCYCNEEDPQYTALFSSKKLESYKAKKADKYKRIKNRIN